MKRQSSKKTTSFDSQRTKIRVGQSANASINQGGNAFSINAVDIGVVRVVGGQQGQGQQRQGKKKCACGG